MNVLFSMPCRGEVPQFLVWRMRRRPAKEPVFNDCGEKTIVEFVLVDDFIFAT